ncbi:hypothetical protein ACI65C_000925 [Semiaphis heraclei]
MTTLISQFTSNTRLYSWDIETGKHNRIHTVDDFVQKLVYYYKGDNLLLQNAGLLNKKSLNNNNNKTNEENAYTDIQAYDIHKEMEMEGFEGIHTETDLEGCEGIYTETYIENNEDKQTETDIEDNEDLHTETADRYENIENMQKETFICDNDDMHTEPEVIVNEENNISFCLPCKNGDFPTGIHRCVKCKKPVHLFGCSVRYIHSEEGFGQSRVCLSCAEKDNENVAEEHWQKRGKSTSLSLCRSAKSYLVSQPGFDKLNLNQKGCEKSIYFLKNGNFLQSKP